MPLIHAAVDGVPDLVSYPSFDDVARDEHSHGRWQQPVHEYYPVNTTYSAPVVVHPVFTVRCKHCDMLFSNRGMKAVLLLRPGLALYSTDAVPCNCSPLGIPLDDQGEEQLRTCACLTQTLYCHGCGDSVGYFIVAPCAQCTSATDRAANGHRFVFHSSDVVAFLRKKQPNPKSFEHYRALATLPSDGSTVYPVFWHQLSSAGEVSPVLSD